VFTKLTFSSTNICGGSNIHQILCKSAIGANSLVNLVRQPELYIKDRQSKQSIQGARYRAGKQVLEEGEINGAIRDSCVKELSLELYYKRLI
jgi:hypothetical protein